MQYCSYCHSRIHIVIFDKKFWNVERAKIWLKNNSFKSDLDMRETPETYRFMQFKPNPGYIYGSKSISKSVRCVTALNKK